MTASPSKSVGHFERLPDKLDKRRVVIEKLHARHLAELVAKVDKAKREMGEEIAEIYRERERIMLEYKRNIK